MERETLDGFVCAYKITKEFYQGWNPYILAVCDALAMVPLTSLRGPLADRSICYWFGCPRPSKEKK